MSRRQFLIRNAIYCFKPKSPRKNCVGYKPFIRGHYRYLSLNINKGEDNHSNDIAGLYEAYDSVHIPSREEVLVKSLGIENKEAGELITKYKFFQNVYSDTLEHNINLAKREFPEDIKIAGHQELLLRFCSTPNLMLEHRLQLMKEILMPVTVDNLSKFRVFFEQNITYLMDSGYIDSKYDIPRRIFTQLMATEDILNQLPKPDIYHNMKLSQLWTQLQAIFIKWQFDVDIIALPSRTQSAFSIKSFTLQLQMLTLLRKYNCLSKSKLRNYLSLVVGIPKVCEDLFLYNKPINGITIENLVAKHPLILLKPIKQILKIEAMLNYIQATPESILSVSHVYRYSPLTILHRIESLIKMTSLTDLRLTSRNAYILISINKCVEKVKSMENDFGKIDSLPSVTIILNKEIPSNTCRSRKWAILSFLKIFLNVPREEVKYGLRLMNLVELPTLSCLKKNYSFLINEGFSKDLIRRSYHLLMFPPYMLKENYDKLPESKYAQEFMASNERDKLLQLLIYYTAKSHNKVGGSVS